MNVKYEAPTMTVLGSFGALTLDNKCGVSHDLFTPQLAVLVGSIVPRVCH